MDKAEFDRRCQALCTRAHGRWKGVLLSLGVDEKVLNKRNQPCPLDGCGGTDRFQYTDKFGDGNYFCRACGAGGGFKLAMHYFGWNAMTALILLERVVGITAPSKSEGRARDMRKIIERILSEAKPVEQGDPVDCYLRGRGLGMPIYPRSLHCHLSLGYYEHDGQSGKPVLVGRYAAMVACVKDRAGQVVSLHRTYLEHGTKLVGRPAKKLLAGGIAGAAIPLGAAGRELAVCEGIETGLAIMKRTGLPVWSGICARNLEALLLPETVRCLRIYGDNDADSMFDGQASAYALARRFMKCPRQGKHRHAEVFIPRAPGEDWAGVLERQALPEQYAA